MVKHEALELNGQQTLKKQAKILDSLRKVRKMKRLMRRKSKMIRMLEILRMNWKN
jgi:hypothetical protein